MTATTTWVLLRGLVRGRGHWLGFEQRLQQTFPDDQVITLDLPGNGELNGQLSPLSVSAMVQSARQQLREQGQSGPYTLLSISLGGMIAIEWMHQAPVEIRQAFIINASLASLNPFWQRLKPANYPGLLWHGILSRNPLGRERHILRATTNRLSPEASERHARTLAALPAVSSGNALRQLWAAARYQAPSLLGTETALIISSSGDRLVDSLCSATIARHWNWPHVNHSSAGHDLPLDDPDWLLKVLAARVLMPPAGA